MNSLPENKNKSPIVLLSDQFFIRCLDAVTIVLSSAKIWSRSVRVGLNECSPVQLIEELVWIIIDYHYIYNSLVNKNDTAFVALFPLITSRCWHENQQRWSFAGYIQKSSFRRCPRYLDRSDQTLLRKCRDRVWIAGQISTSDMKVPPERNHTS